jgi:hypothetical protein
MSERCKNVRDRLPDLMAERLDDAEAAEVRSHVALCKACAAELALVRSLAADVVTVPIDLEARVLLAVQRKRRNAWASPGRLAMAATVVFALVTASLIDQPGREPGIESDTSVALAVDEALTASWPAADEPLLEAAPSLYQLSMEELEILLQELGS